MKLLADLTKEEQASLRNDVCPDASDAHINYFLRVCHARNVDPFSGLLYMQLRSYKGKTKAGISPTIDGARAAAARTGSYGGSDEPEFDTEDADKPPAWCKVTVYRVVKGVRCPFTSKCRWREFVPSPPNDFQWKAKPFHMLAKVTEMQSLRKAFPELVGGANEDDYEVEVEDAPKEESSGNSRLALEWQNAVKAFEPLGKSETDILGKLGILTRDRATDEHMEILRTWYEELIRDK